MKKVLLAAAALFLCTSCPQDYVDTLKVTCPATTVNGAWVLAGAGSQDVDVDYWCDGGCLVQVVGTTPAGTPQPGPQREHSGVKSHSFAAISKADFACSGTGGQCEFRITKLSPSSGPPTKKKERVDTNNYACGSGMKTIYSSTVACEILVRVTMSAGCSATLRSNSNASTTLTAPAGSKLERFVSFSGATSVSATCGGASTVAGGGCSYQVHAFW